MNSKSLLSSLLIPGVLLAASHTTPGRVDTNYDQFKDQTTITIMGQQINDQPIFYGWSQFRGHKPKPAEDINLGFLVDKGCPHPNFLADGKRVVPDSSGDSLPGFSNEEFQKVSGGVQNFVFVFSFFNSQSIKPIATARTVQYQICERAYNLSEQDQVKLRQFLTLFK